MAKLYCPVCPDFNGFTSCSHQALEEVAAYEWCRKYLVDLEETNDTITLSSSLFLSLIRKAYTDAFYGARQLEFNSWSQHKDYPLQVGVIGSENELEELGLLGKKL